MEIVWDATSVPRFPKAPSAPQAPPPMLRLLSPNLRMAPRMSAAPRAAAYSTARKSTLSRSPPGPSRALTLLSQ